VLVRFIGGGFRCAGERFAKLQERLNLVPLRAMRRLTRNGQISGIDRNRYFKQAGVPCVTHEQTYRFLWCVGTSTGIAMEHFASPVTVDVNGVAQCSCFGAGWGTATPSWLESHFVKPQLTHGMVLPN